MFCRVMTECEICKKEIEKGQRFILNGTVPSTWSNVAYRLTRGPAVWSIADFGKMYHEECYKKKIEK